MQNAFNDILPGAFVVDSFAVPGTRAPQYAGLEENFFGELIDYTQATLDLDPDVVVFMLGTNDAGTNHCFAPGVDCFSDYISLVPHFWERYRDAGVRLVVATPPPIIASSESREIAQNRLETQYVPWLKAQTAATGIPVVDVFRLMQEVDNWQDFYSDDDSIHPLPEGYEWIAGAVRDAVFRSFGDVNSDGDVDIVDLNNVRNNFDAAGPFVLGDTNGDNVVDIEDLNAVRNHFGGFGYADLPVPEPATSVYVIAGMIIVAATHGRRWLRADLP